MRRGRGDYKHPWGDTEQPTTIIGAGQFLTWGNLISFGVPGQLVGMRWGHAPNANGAGCLGLVWNGGLPLVLLRVCMAAPFDSTGLSGIIWTNMFFHPFIRVVVGTPYMFAFKTLNLNIGYNDAALLAADLVIGNFTYPKHTATNPNGGTNPGNSLYPNTAANGRRYTIDPLFLPD